MLHTFTKFRVLLALLFAITSMSGHTAERDMRSLEDALETNTAEIVLPGSDTGALYFKSCATCNQKNLQINATTKFRIKAEQLSYAEFKKAAESGDRMLMVFYDPTTHVIKRLKL